MKVFSDQWSAVSQMIFSLALSALLFALCVSVEAQQPKRVPRIGILQGGSTDRFETFWRALHELGYLEGKNLIIVYPSAEGTLPARAAELVRLKVDVIVTAGATTTRAAKEATTTIPIVFLQDPDPVGNGLVTNLARPAGNLTGLSQMTADLAGKRLELFREVLPKLSRLAVLGNSANAGNGIPVKRDRTRCSDTRSAASTLGRTKRQGH